MKKKKESVEAEKRKIEAKLREVQERVKKEEEQGGDNLDDIKKSLTEVEKAAKNVDTLSRDGFSKTIVNTMAKPTNEELTEEEREKKMKKFVKENEKKIKDYGMLKKFDDSKKFLMDGN